ncbi:chitin synthase-domain-containing protein [Mycena albidolilacea]|uniref:Chitin synthase-domain-containing protein n=1 Tax=Mycena albidolilacea TaxID=1033008 RepID=A0AAD6ZRD3_9AGAR|nr:chitin synthase-domain-containing protein [Mycena albidolilacea]
MIHDMYKKLLGVCGEMQLANWRQSIITMMQPLLMIISNQLIQDYSENRVDTLHMKNMLHLGEDQYLTTLLKHFPAFKTQSCSHSLVFLEQLCGFCCFSMRFIVMIDLVSTLTQPVTMHQQIQTISFIMIIAVYAIQMFVFILRLTWDMIGCMFFYILTIPVFSFYLPLYSVWKMDDFSCDQTHVVLGESGKMIHRFLGTSAALQGPLPLLLI